MSVWLLTRFPQWGWMVTNATKPKSPSLFRCSLHRCLALVDMEPDSPAAATGTIWSVDQAQCYQYSPALYGSSHMAGEMCSFSSNIGLVLLLIYLCQLSCSFRLHILSHQCRVLPVSSQLEKITFMHIINGCNDIHQIRGLGYFATTAGSCFCGRKKLCKQSRARLKFEVLTI